MATTEPARPNNLIARLRTAGGSWTDVVTAAPRRGVVTTGRVGDFADWKCHGCSGRNAIGLRREQAMQEAHHHSALCRAI